MPTFTLHPGFVTLSADAPGASATMIGPDGRSLPFRSELSIFNDAERKYTWAFTYDGPPLQGGERFTFATREWSATGVTTSVTTVSIGIRTLAAEEVAALPEVVEARSVLPPPRGVSSRAPKVSVVTCTRNRPDFLRAAVMSLRAQTDPDWEHLIYDDASENSGVSDVLAWAQEDPRVRVWRREVNLDRPAVLWNYMMDRAHGRYLTVLDDDNAKLSRFVEVMAGELDADPELDIVTCGWIVQGDQPDTEYHLNLSTCIPELDRLSTCDGGAMLYRREAFERAGYFSEALRTNEDWDWLRRALRVAKFKNLYECLSTYRSHPTNRMHRAEALGNDADVVSVKERVLSPTMGLRFSRPDPARLTHSQEDVCRAVTKAIAGIPWVEEDARFALVVSPFQMNSGEISAAVAGADRALSLHMEDPYALAANLSRVHEMRALVRELWVCTNDAATVPYYREVVGDRVLTCPLLGPDDSVRSPKVDDRDIDVLLCGYAYPSRRRFVRALLPLLRGLRVVLVGDGWEQYPASETLPTQNVAYTYGIHARAKTVVCLHRVHGDCSDGPVEPRTVNRGFMEGYSGARVFVDRTRSAHPFDQGDVVWYEDEADLAEKLRNYLGGPRSPVADRFAERCAREFTYRTRLARILNCVRSPRFLAEIP